jgi:hypothetical protein
VLPSALFPSVADRFLFSGRPGSPPRDLDGSLGFPKDFGKEMGRNETRFFRPAPTGALEKVRADLAFLRQSPGSPCLG